MSERVVTWIRGARFSSARAEGNKIKESRLSEGDETISLRGQSVGGDGKRRDARSRNECWCRCPSAAQQLKAEKNEGSRRNRARIAAA